MNGRRTAWALQVGEIAGIPIRVHWTFLLLLVWVGSVTLEQEAGFTVGVVLCLLLFACVALHEMGHALTARRFGVRTFEIVLYPVGGVARMGAIPAGWPELSIALAGPAVNLLVALPLAPLVLALSLQPRPSLEPGPLVAWLFFGNLMLFFFNLVPAFPMDGGRILRSLLTLFLPAPKATAIAAAVGQGLALVFAAVGVFAGELLLVLIALLVFVGAGQEAAFSRRQAMLAGRIVRDAMVSRFERLAPHEPLRRAGQLLLRTAQKDFPVVDAWGRAVGVLTRGAILAGLRRLGPEVAILEAMDRSPLVVAPDADLGQVLGRLQGLAPAVVVQEGDLVGLVTLDSIADLVGILEGLQAEPSRGQAADP